MQVSNVKSVILWESTEKIIFYFCDKLNKYDCAESDWIPINSEENFKLILSQWEKRALYLLNVLFEINNKIRLIKKWELLQQLLIIDDIADSFDYKNKYAIIQYLKDLADLTQQNWEKYFNLIILTHNFDFYRTCKSRLFINNNFEAVKNNEWIKLIEYKYTKDEPWEIWKKDLSINNIIALIPFVRNLIEYWDNNRELFMLLTHIIHYKNQTFYNKDWNTLIKQERINKNKIWDFNISQTNEILFWDIEKIFMN